MKINRSTFWAFFAFTFLFIFTWHNHLKPKSYSDGQVEFSSLIKNNRPERWALSGFLPNAPSEKVYIVIKDRLIERVSTRKPDGIFVLESESFIFPGLIDLHNHVKFNVLPLWDKAQGQFLNRFEWRDQKKFPLYTQAVKLNIDAYKTKGVCPAVRWGELKAITGGVTSIQGISGVENECADKFLIHNVELPGEYGLEKQRIKAAMDLIAPPHLKAVYLPMIAPEVSKLGSISPENSYDTALLSVLKKKPNSASAFPSMSIMDWLSSFTSEVPSLKNGLQLLMGEDFDVSNQKNSEEDFQNLSEEIEAYLTKNSKMNPSQIDNQILNMHVWLFGDGKRIKGYLNEKFEIKKLSENELIRHSIAISYLAIEGVLSLDTNLKRYFAKYEARTRRGTLDYLNTYSPTVQSLGFLTHLSEGQRKDKYNQSEYEFVKKLSLNKPGLILIHAVGLDKTQLEDVAKNNISIVWSPFSNLLLYGETLDVSLVKKLKINLSLGADWTPTGSKTILDELKIARQYLDRYAPAAKVTDRELVEMITVNPAKAMRLDKIIGKIEVGFQADILLLSKNKKSTTNPYSQLVQATQENIDLVIVNGEPFYGDVSKVQNVSQVFGDSDKPEILPLNKNLCAFQKAFRNPWKSKLDVQLEKDSPKVNLRTFAGIEEQLKSILESYRNEMRKKNPQQAAKIMEQVDPIYNCEDSKYQQTIQNFISSTLQKNSVARPSLRKQYKLNDSWSPLSDSGPDSKSDTDGDGDD